MNSLTVHLTDDAARDLEEIFDYIDRHDLPGRADYVLEQIEKAFGRLSDYCPHPFGIDQNRWNIHRSARQNPILQTWGFFGFRLHDYQFAGGTEGKSPPAATKRA